MKAYLIIDFLIRDLGGLMSCVNRIAALIKRHGGQYLVEGVVPKVVERKVDEGQRSVLLGFSSIELAESFLCEHASLYLHTLWAGTTQNRISLVQGKAP
ncbi:MAG: hypothetical protein ACI8Z1_000079 [Candidatus Azotimanducaceae bacterium]|jgi:uncharacterized protein (DUF1330 family)